MGKMRALWHGETPLAEAIWTWAVFWGVVVNLVTSGLYWVLAVNDMHPVLLVPAYFLPLPFNVFVCVAVWRSAARFDGPPAQAELARWGTLSGMLVLSLT